MHENSFELLEEKVLKAVRTIQDLREEGRRFETECNELQAKYDEKNNECDRLRREVEDLRTKAQTAATMEQKRRTIEEKVGGLLSKLDSIE